MSDGNKFTVDIDEILNGSKSGLDLDEMFYLEDLSDRKMYITANIEQFTIADIVRNILTINKQDAGIKPEERKPIILYVTSCGGSVDDGFELIDVIKSSITPIYTVNLGYQYSMGFLIGIAGHKRFAMKNSKFLLHDGMNFVFDSAAKAQDRFEFSKVVESRVKAFVIENSKITPEEYDSNFSREWYMFSDEAKEKGFTDYIVGEDCTLEDIIL